MPKPLSLLLTAVLVLALAPAARAGAPVAVAYRPDLAQSPALAGDRVLWIDGIVALDVFGAPVTGGRAEKLLAAGADWPRPLALAASPTRAALAFQEDSPPNATGRQTYVYSRLLAGPSAGPLAFRGGSPDDAPSGDRVHGADVAGDVLVAVRSAPGARSGVDDRPARITVQDLSASTAETDLVAPSSATLGAHVSAAGNFVAYTVLAAAGAATLVVADRTTGAAVTRLAFARAPDTFDVQADGTVAVAERLGPDEQKIGWVRAGETGLHTLVARTRRLGLSLAGDRVAYARATSAGAAEIVVQALDGPFVPASFPIATPTGFDFDGTRVAFASSECVYTALADGVPAGGATPAGPCPRAKTLVRPAAPSVALTRRKRAVRVRLACPMAGEDGCRGRVVLTYTKRDGRPARLVKRGFRLPRGTERKVRLRVVKRLVRALRERSGNRLGIAVRTVDEAGRVALAGDSVRLTRPKRRPG
jgi:hypothetical protein